MTRRRLRRSAVLIATALAMLVVLRPEPAQAKVTSSQTFVGSGDALSFAMESEDGFIRSVISV